MQFFFNTGVTCTRLVADYYYSLQLLVLMIQAGNCVYTKLADKRSYHAEEVMDIELKYTNQAYDITDV